jgi:hypothetical protein
MVEIVSKDAGGRMKAGKRECEGCVKRCQMGKCQVNSEARNLRAYAKLGQIDRRPQTDDCFGGQRSAVKK